MSADSLITNQAEAIKIDFFGVKIELYPVERIIKIFADENFDMALKPGRAKSGSGQLFSSVVIAPFLAPGTSPAQQSVFNRETVR